MITKTFGDKKIIIRKLEKTDLKNTKGFQDFVNSLIREKAKISMNKEVGRKEELDYLKSTLKTVKGKKRVYLLAESDNKIVATASISQDRGNLDHVGGFGIVIREKYRGIGLGKYLTSEIIKLAKKDLKPKPKIIKLEVYANNIPAIALYKKMGFKIVGKIPKQIQFKGKLIGEYIMIKNVK